MSYFIERWDVIQVDGKNKAVVYVQPDAKLYDYFTNVGDQVSVFIRGTKSPYEKGVYYARIDRPQTMYGYRPNLKTDELCLIMEAVWMGYPIGDLGIVDILNINKPVEVTPLTEENKTSSWILPAVLLLLLLLLYFSNGKLRSNF